LINLPGNAERGTPPGSSTTIANGGEPKSWAFRWRGTSLSNPSLGSGSSTPSSRSAPIPALKEPMKLVTVFVNWRQPLNTVEAIRAVRRQSLPTEIVVVENGSGDRSAQLIRERVHDIVVLEQSSNCGFGAGCNVGIQWAVERDAEYVWLLNNDATPAIDCLEHLFRVAESDSHIAVVGGRIHDPERKVPDHAGSVMSPLSLRCRYTLSQKELDDGRYKWITGACMLIRLSAIKLTGAFDDRFFMYWEDADLCTRFIKAGYSLAVSEKALITHCAGTSSKNSRILRFQWHLESQLRWLSKHSSAPHYTKAVVFIRHLVKSILTRDWDRLAMTFSHLWMAPDRPGSAPPNPGG